MRRWRTVSRSILHANPYWRYRRDVFELPDGGEGEYFYVETPGSVMVIPIDESGRLVLVRQYRYLNDRVSLEFPGGGMGQCVSPEEAVRKELSEEAGFAAGTLLRLGEMNPFNGVTSEICVVFEACDLTPGALTPDHTEEFDIHRIDISEFRAMVGRGEIWDGMTLAAWALYEAARA